MLPDGLLLIKVNSAKPSLSFDSYAFSKLDRRRTAQHLGSQIITRNVREMCSEEESVDWTMYLEFKTPSPIAAQPIDQTLSLWSSQMEHFGFIANHFIFNPGNVEPEAEIGGGNDNVNCGDDDVDMYKLPVPFIGQNPLENHYRPFMERMIRALCYIKELTEQHQLLAQVWAPVWSGNNYVLTTSGQPFILGPHSNGLNQYRTVSLMYMFALDGETDHSLGLPGRVFMQKLPEWTPDVQYYSSSEYPQINHAIQYNVRGILALPVFEPSSMSCVGVLELILTSQKINYASEIDMVCKALEAVNLRSSITLNHPKNQICNEGRQNALSEILEVLTTVCEAFNLPLAQTWIPCRQRSVLAYGGGRKNSCSSCDSRGTGRVCMSTIDVPFYVLDAHMWGFREACTEHHLQIGQGVPGRAFSSYRPFLCCDISEFCKVDYPLVHYARMFQLRGSFAICLKSQHTGDDDYVLEFFLPSSIRDSAEQLKLLDFIWTTIKQNLQNLVPASGNTLEEEREQIEIAEKNINHLEVHMNDVEVVPTPAALQNEDGLRPSDGQVNEELNSVVTRSELVCADEGTSRQDTNLFFCLKEADAAKRQRENGQNDKIQLIECLKGKEKKITFTMEDIQSFWSKNMRQADAGKVLGVSRSTMKRRLRELGVKEWKSSRSKSQCLSLKNKHGQSRQLKPVNDCNLAPGSPASEYCLVDETRINSGRELIELPSVARQDSSPSTFVIKARYKEDTVRIDFSCNSSVDELVTEVGKRFKLELCRFKINYLDEDKECMLMTHNSDLQHALRASLSSGSKIIRLMVSDL